MDRIYCISGLGADARVFQNLRIKNRQLKVLHWPHFDKHDDMACYAEKLGARIKTKRPVIIGVSFGGMLTVEIAKQMDVGKAFIVSSAKTFNELPFMSRFARRLTELNLIPVGMFKNIHKPLYDRFGAETKQERELLSQIMEDTDNKFLRWSMNALLNWRNELIPPNLVHIHGTTDKMIPSANIHPTHWIEKGTHFMVYNRAAEVSALIESHLESI